LFPAIVFDTLGMTGSNNPLLPKDVRYTIRVDGARTPDTQHGGPT